MMPPNRSRLWRPIPLLPFIGAGISMPMGFPSWSGFGRIEDTAVHELALNPDAFTGRSDEEILSTLAHEMAHVWQQTHGKPKSNRYHERQWAAKMKEIGLQPTDTGEPGGKETGQSVTHYVIAGGPYVRAYAKLAATGWQPGESEESQQNEIHLPGVRTERVG
jgi:hypothetical protein